MIEKITLTFSVSHLEKSTCEMGKEIILANSKPSFKPSTGLSLVPL